MARCASCGAENRDDFRFCPACGAALTAAETPPKAAPEPSTAGSREARRTVTILFADAVGSTALGESADPETVRRVLGRVFDMAREVIHGHGGTIEKFIGDAIMAVFGVPVVHEDDALRAVRAAAELIERLGVLNAELERQFGVEIQLRTGVNTGEVATGDPHTDEIFATGDAVNVAARLEQAAPPMEILLGEQTWHLTSEFVEAQPIEPLTLKGKAEPVVAYRLVGLIDREPGLLADAEMIGRSSELAALAEALEDATRSGSPRVAVVVGDAGVGKSRLVDGFLAALTDTDAVVLRGRCLSYGEGISLWPLTEAIRRLARLDDAESDDEARKRLARLVGGAESPQGASADRTTAVVETLADIAGVRGAKGAAGQTTWAVRHLLEALAHDGAPATGTGGESDGSRRRPVVLVVDDVHWAEPDFIDLVGEVASATVAPLLVLLVARPAFFERFPDRFQADDARLVWLEPLGESECAELVAGLLGASVAPEITARLCEASEGNPLFVQELVAMLVREERIVRDEVWLPAEDISTLPLPPSIEAVLGARIDALSHAQQRLLERAAVVGEIFYVSALEALSPADVAARLEPDLAALQRAGLVHPSASELGGEAAYRFHHILLRDAAERRLRRSDQAYLHERFADWLLERSSAAGEAVEEIAGYHLERAYRALEGLGPIDQRGADLGRRASALLAKAGRRAWTRTSDELAGGILVRAAALLPPGRERAALLVETTVALEVGDPVRAQQIGREGVSTARAFGDEPTAVLGELFVNEAEQMALDGAADLAVCLDLAMRAMELLEAEGDERRLVWAMFSASQNLENQGRLREAYEMGERTQALAHKHQMAREQALGIGPLIGAYVSVDRPALARVERGWQLLAEQRDNLPVAATIYSLIAVHLSRAGRADEARAASDQALGIAQDLGMSVFYDLMHFDRGQIEWYSGDVEAAERYLQRVAEALEGYGAVGVLANVTGCRGLIRARTGRFEEALADAERARSCSVPGDIYPRWMSTITRALVLAETGTPTEALSLVDGLLPDLRDCELAEVLADALRTRATALVALRRPNDASEAVAEAIALYEQSGAYACVEPSLGELAAIEGLA